MVILAIGPHPDDIELGCAGTLVRHKEVGDSVHMLILTLGEGGEASPEIRRKEAEASAAILGVDSIKFGNISAYDLFAVRQGFIHIVEGKVAQVQPDRVYCPTHHDRHQVHEAGARCGIIGSSHVKEVFLYELPSTTSDFKPGVFIDISRTLGKKIECLSAFDSQSSKYYMRISAICGLARYRAFQARIGGEEPNEEAAAEAFCTERMIIGDNDKLG